MTQMVKNLLAMWKTWVQSLDQEDPLEKELATHSSILAWRIPWTEEPGGLQSMGRKESDVTEQLTHTSYWQHHGKASSCQCRRCRFHAWVETISWRRKWQPTSVFLPGESHGQRSLEVYSPQSCKESDRTEYTAISPNCNTE